MISLSVSRILKDLSWRKMLALKVLSFDDKSQSCPVDLQNTSNKPNGFFTLSSLKSNFVGRLNCKLMNWPSSSRLPVHNKIKLKQKFKPATMACKHLTEVSRFLHPAVSWNISLASENRRLPGLSPASLSTSCRWIKLIITTDKSLIHKLGLIFKCTFELLKITN